MQPYTISAIRSRFYKEGMSQNDVWELTCKEGIVNFNLNNDSFKPIEENQIKISSISTKE